MESQMELRFSVNAPVLPDGQFMFVTGDCAELGLWAVDDALKLSLAEDSTIDDGGGDQRWVGSVQANLPPFHVAIVHPVHIHYRYFIGEILAKRIGGAAQAINRIIVRRWETHVDPRIYGLSTSDAPSDCFGYIGSKYVVQQGWLIDEVVVHLKLFNNPISIFNTGKSDQLSVKVTSIDLQVGPKAADNDSEHQNGNAVSHQNGNAASHQNGVRVEMNGIDDGGDSAASVDVAMMEPGKCVYVPQEKFGQVYTAGDFLSFQCQLKDFENTAFKVELFEHNKSTTSLGSTPVLVGMGYITSLMLHGSVGSIAVPVCDARHRPHGNIFIDYLVVYPMSGWKCDLKYSWRKYWNYSRKTIEIGHRGSGNSFHKNPLVCADIRENTIASLKHAAQYGADYVEFDVQLSKDKIPVLYHDFAACICLRKKPLKDVDEDEVLELSVQEMTLRQLQMLKLFHVSQKTMRGDSNRKFNNDDFLDNQPFPELTDALAAIDPHVGFNVEIKWTQQKLDGRHELDNPNTDMNSYTDIILEHLYRHAGQRRIVLSCFNPDMCTMLHMKQNKYPVLFLTQGQTKKWPQYTDPRTWSIHMAIYFAQSVDLLGIDVHTEDILNDPTVIRACKDHDLVMFCWGDDNNDPQNISKLKAWGLNGIIYDRIDVYKDEKKNIFFMETQR